MGNDHNDNNENIVVIGLALIAVIALILLLLVLLQNRRPGLGNINLALLMSLTWNQEVLPSPRNNIEEDMVRDKRYNKETGCVAN